MLAEWIKRHLELVGEDYPYRMWREYSKVSPNVRYETVRYYVYRLAKAGLIEVSREERGARPHLVRRYYRLTERGREASDEEWREAVRGV